MEHVRGAPTLAKQGKIERWPRPEELRLRPKYDLAIERQATPS